MQITTDQHILLSSATITNNLKRNNFKQSNMKTKTHDFTDAKVGDKVTCTLYGIGIIITNTDNSTFPILVRFEKGYNSSYTLDGRIMSEAKQGLYHGHIEFTVTTKPIRPDLKVDDRVIVWSDGTAYRYKRYFKEWGVDGKINCFAGGCTSWNDGGYCTHWDNYEIPEPITNK